MSRLCEVRSKPEFVPHTLDCFALLAETEVKMGKYCLRKYL